MVSASIPKLNYLKERENLLNIKFDSEILNEVEKSPYLGLVLDNSLKWDSQIQRISKNISYKLFLLRRLSRILSSDVLNKIYISQIQPCLEYGISIWGFCSEYNKMIIERLQHRAARIILRNFDYINVRGCELVRQLRWQSINQRRDYFIATLMHKCIHNTGPIHLTNNVIMTAHTHDIPTRASAKGIVQIPEPKCELFKTSFRYQAAILWNKLPPELRGLPDINIFKALYKRLYFDVQ